MGKGEGGRVRWTMITRKLMMVTATTTLTLTETEFPSIQSKRTNRRIMTMTRITTKATTTKTTT